MALKGVLSNLQHNWELFSHYFFVYSQQWKYRKVLNLLAVE